MAERNAWDRSLPGRDRSERNVAKKKMSLKKRMFRSNMAILICALAVLMAVILVVLGIFEDSFEHQLDRMDHSQVRIEVERDGKLLENVEVHELMKLTMRESFSTLLAATVLIGVGTIVLLLVLTSWFTKRMNRIITEPLEELQNGAERISEGILTEPIVYRGEAEFEQVCQVFNSMQETILADQKARERNEQARTDMVTGISHDLRTPLTSIRGYIKGVLDGVADTEEKKRMYLQTAYESAGEMNGLLQKLFDFSRMESGQMPFHMVRVDVAEYAAAYVAQKESVLAPSEVRFSFEAEENLPEVEIDVEQVHRIFENLLENSLKYAQVKPVEIRVSVVREEKGVKIEWKDNGQGVPTEKLGRIFERFYRCDEARSEKGSGVGLYVVQYIMKKHQGNATAENENGLKVSLHFTGEDGKWKES